MSKFNTEDLVEIVDIPPGIGTWNVARERHLGTIAKVIGVDFRKDNYYYEFKMFLSYELEIEVHKQEKDVVWAREQDIIPLFTI